MCNAWNHSLDCTCGWGGEGHAGRRSVGSAIYVPMARPVFKTYSEFLVGCTIPNAKCPVCGDPVFFYRSPSNGRVFFDELGPPWPKHPCTISPHKVITANGSANSESVDMSIQWYVSSEWKPFLVEGVLKVDIKNNISEIFGYLGEHKRSFFTRLDGITTDFPYFIKEGDSEIRLLTFNPTSENYLFEFVVKKYRSELTGSILESAPQTPKVNSPVKNRALSNKKSVKNKNKPNNHIDKSGGKNARAARPKVVGKFQDQLLKLKDFLKSN